MSNYFVDQHEAPQHEISPGVEIRTAACEHMMLSHVRCRPNSTIGQHSHPHEQVGMVVAGSARFVIGEEERLLRQGDLYRIPGDVEHSVHILEDGLEAIDVFHPLRDDYL